MSELDELRRHRLAGRHDEHLAAAAELASRAPGNPEARIEAAFALDRAGDEHGAIRHYDAAWQLGVPAELRRRVIVGYGSTLRNVGRCDEAIALYSAELERDPGYPPYLAFLALALHSAGHARAALATMLNCALEVADQPGNASDPFDGYQRALGEYYAELLGEELPR